jgi:predicted small metal-binding protein
MAKLIECEDGFVVRGDDDDELVANAERHIAEAHPDLVGKLSRDEILAMAKDELLSIAEKA